MCEKSRNSCNMCEKSRERVLTCVRIQDLRWYATPIEHSAHAGQNRDESTRADTVVHAAAAASNMHACMHATSQQLPAEHAGLHSTASFTIT
jgi:hypothetical protein